MQSSNSAKRRMIDANHKNRGAGDVSRNLLKTNDIGLHK